MNVQERCGVSSRFRRGQGHGVGVSSRGVSSGDMLLDLMGLKGRTELLIPLVVVLVCGISASVVNEKSKVIARGRTVASPRQQVQHSLSVVR